jgi:hypothetical protein
MNLAAKVAVCLTSFLFGAASQVLAENDRPDDPPVLTGPYLGQEPPGETPRVFAPGIVSHEDYSIHTFVAVPGGEEFVFDRYGEREYQTGAVFVTRIEDGRWTDPEIHPVFAQFDDVFLPRISPDGNRWFFTSRSLPMPEGASGKVPLFYIEKTDTGWSSSTYITQAIHASATRDGTLWYMVEGRDNGWPGYRRLENGRYSDLEFAEPREVFGRDDAHLAVAPDGSYLIFDSQRRPREGECRLHISFRKPDDTWTEPQTMGRVIKRRAAMASITYDGKFIFFMSGDDAFWVDARIVDDLKPPELRE